MGYISKAITACLYLGLASSASAQTPPAAEQSTGFNSSFSLTPEQIAAAKLSAPEAASINHVLHFDRSQLASGGPHEDDFYTLPVLTNTTGPLQPGTLLKTQAFTDPAPFAIPPNTALSRILYTTQTHNGTVVPASAFILWPFTPRSVVELNRIKRKGDEGTRTSYQTEEKVTKAPVVLWSHGTSGFFASAAPSSHRALWYGDAAPFTLALAGYAVVASDYAGLGISKTWGSDHGNTSDGNISHQYLMSRVSARDGLYALRAARTAFADKLDDRFVAMGHSQGGGVAWGVADVLAERDPQEEFRDLAQGYRGTVAGSPTTDVFSGPPSFIAPFVGLGLASVFPSFRLADWFTPAGAARVELFRALEGGIGVAQHLFMGDGTNNVQLLKDGWNETWYVEAYGNLANAGRRPFRGPMLVVQGTEDVYVSYDVTNATVAATCDTYPESVMEFLVVDGAGHAPSLDATRQIWLDWIQARFEGKPPVGTKERGCKRTELSSFLPVGQYLKVGNSFPQWAGAPQYNYQVPLGL
ncbi:secretory lipase [Apiospora arundinis]|uniref:Secretory lipase n=1 Tax=Apiospora arundinis TaxID=335852 RepID=A0ABR2HLY2_9PEZI